MIHDEFRLTEEEIKTAAQIICSERSYKKLLKEKE